MLTSDKIVWYGSAALFLLGIIYIAKMPTMSMYVFLPRKCPFDATLKDRDNKKLSLPDPSQRKLVKMEQHISTRRTNRSIKKQKIPKRIIQTNEKQDVPKGMYDATHTFIRDNPDYEYIYFTDEQARRFLIDNYPLMIVHAYDKLIPGAFKADLFRYCVLYKLGGVYIDMGMVSELPLDKLIGDDDEFISPEDNTTRGIYNAFMCCAPNHPILKRVIELCVDNIDSENMNTDILAVTGPRSLGEAFENVIHSPVEANHNYGDGVRLISHVRVMDCLSGEIYDGDLKVISTRYPVYPVDRKWYNTKPHYSDLWNEGKVFKK